MVPVVVGSNPTGHPKNQHTAPMAQLNERGSPAGKNQPCGASCFVDSFCCVRFRLAASAAVRVRPTSCCPGQQLGGRMSPCKSACSEILTQATGAARGWWSYRAASPPRASVSTADLPPKRPPVPLPGASATPCARRASIPSRRSPWSRQPRCTARSVRRCRHWPIHPRGAVVPEHDSQRCRRVLQAGGGLGEAAQSLGYAAPQRGKGFHADKRLTNMSERLYPHHLLNGILILNRRLYPHLLRFVHPFSWSVTLELF